MSLGPGARELLDAGRVRGEPSAQSRARIRSALIRRLGPAAAVATVSSKAGAGVAVVAAAGAPSGGAALLKLAVLCVVGGALSGGGYIAMRRVSAERVAVAPATVAPLPSRVAPALPPAVVPAQEAVAPTPGPVAPAAVATAAARAKVAAVRTPGGDGVVAGRETVVARPPEPEASASHAPAPVDRLQEELSLVRAAHDALRAGQPAVALERMDEHRRAYPDGALSEERDALRVGALCALGRADAQAEARAFLANHPASPFVARVREACLR
jgi:hypothetical protein